jgi:hypothetical protein
MNNSTLKEKLSNHLDDWNIRTIGMIDKSTYLVVADWEPKQNTQKKFEIESGETSWTKMACIDLTDDTVWWLVQPQGLGKTYCDGGIIHGNKEAFFGAFNGITYHLDYAKNSFEHEELLMTTQNAGINDIKLIGEHFYIADSGNEVFRRDGVRKWTMISKESREFFQKYRQEGGVNALDGFSEKDIYFIGENGFLWHFDGKKSSMIDTPCNFPFTKIVCADDAKVYVGGRQGQLLVGKDNQWQVVISSKSADACGVNTMHSMVYYKGTLYAGMRHDLMKLHKGKWVSANLEGIYNAEFLSSKDGMMLIGTNYSLFSYDGENVKSVYRNEKYLDAMFIGNKLTEVGAELLESGHGLLNEMEKGKK